jgi:hypothetical protein
MISQTGQERSFMCECPIEIFGVSVDVVFSSQDGVFVETNSFKINLLKVFAQIRRHASPDYQTFLSSILSWASHFSERRND